MAGATLVASHMATSVARITAHMVAAYRRISPDMGGSLVG